MKFPVKLNRERWPLLGRLGVPSTTDPRAIRVDSDSASFTRAMSILKFGTTFKTTRKARFPLSVAAIAQRMRGSSPVVLDVGASDGSTSLDVMSALEFRTYFVTDLNIEVHRVDSGGATWFYDCEGVCILGASDDWVVYRDTEGSIYPFGAIAAKLLARAPAFSPDMERVLLINPAVRSRPGDVRVLRHDLMTPWTLERADLVIAANILNRAYFPDEVIAGALRRLRAALQPGGRLAVIDNRPDERSSLFRLADGAVVLEERIHGGTDIEALVLAVLGQPA